VTIDQVDASLILAVVGIALGILAVFIGLQERKVLNRHQQVLWRRLIRGAALVGAATGLVEVVLFIIGTGSGQEDLRNVAVAMAPFTVILVVWAALMRWTVSRQIKEP